MTTPSDPGATPASGPAPGAAPTPAPGQAPEPRATPVVSWEAPAEEVGPAPGVKFAPHGGRFLAYIIDGLITTAILILMTIALGVVLAAVAGTSGRSSGLTVAIGAVGTILYVIAILAVIIGYFPYFWAKNAQTPGMKPFHLYVVRDSDGGKISGAQAFVRMLGMWVSGAVLYLGFAWVFIDARRRGWHDLMAGTVVVEKAASPR
jgi:uncharacterized RDD family membrane protein YckC